MLRHGIMAQGDGGGKRAGNKNNGENMFGRNAKVNLELNREVATKADAWHSDANAS